MPCRHHILLVLTEFNDEFLLRLGKDHQPPVPRRCASARPCRSFTLRVISSRLRFMSLSFIVSLHAARQPVPAALHVPFFHCVTPRCASVRPCSAEKAPQVRLPSPLHSLTNKSLIEKCKWGVSALFAPENGRQKCNIGVSALFFELWICKRKLWEQSALSSFLPWLKKHQHRSSIGRK